MVAHASSSLPEPARFYLAGSEAVHIADEAALCLVLVGLGVLIAGESATLQRDAKHYIKATRHGELWAVVARRGGWWTFGSFNAEGSTDWSEREMRASRSGRPLLSRPLLKWLFTSRRPTQELSIGQVETLFVEFLLDRRFSLPFLGA